MYINKYLATLPIDTKIKKNKILYLKVPAAKAMGSPINGTHDNNKDHFPYFLKISVAFWNKNLFIGNQGLFIKKFTKYPNTQLITEPKILPKDANNNNRNTSYFPDSNSVTKYTSEANGKNVPKLRQKINSDK